MLGTISAAFFFGTLVGCSSSEPEVIEQKPKEIPTSLSTPSELSEEELIFRAKRYYEVGLYTESRENFEAIRATFPLGAYGEFAEIKSADALFDTGAFGEAARAYEEIARNRPVSEALPYVLFRAGRSHQLSQRGIGRDMTALDRAQEKYDELLTRYPNSRHAWAATEFLAVVMKDKEDYATSIRDFYRHQGKYAAAEVRTNRIDQVIAPAAAAAQARASSSNDSEEKLLALAKLRIKAEEAAKFSRASAVSGSKTVTSGASSGTLSAGTLSSGTISTVPSSVYRIVKTDCRLIDKQIQATVFLNKEITNREWLNEIVNETSFKVQDATAEANLELTPCGTSGLALKVKSDGQISLFGKTEVKNPLVTTLPNPPRLIILASVQ